MRGGAWTPDLLLRANWDEIRTHVRYVEHLGLNTVRIEGKLVWDELYDLFDEAGILLILGWNCCDYWQKWPQWTAGDRAIATASVRDQSLQLRNHPSIIDFLIGSDEAPPVAVEKAFVDALKQTNWPNVISSSAADTTTTLLGKSGFKMTGPYDWVAPAYWELDTANGGAYGFNTETSPGPSIPNLESLRKMLSPAELDKLWKQPATTQYHAGKAPFDDVGIFADRLEVALRRPFEPGGLRLEGPGHELRGRARHVRGIFSKQVRSCDRGHPVDAQQCLAVADLAPVRLLTWLPAPPIMARKGNETLHIQYSYDNQSIYVVNHSIQKQNGLTATAKIYNVDGSEKYSNAVTLDALEDSAKKAFTLPAVAGRSPTYFLALTLTNGAGQVVSNNVYWLSTTQETLDFASSDWYHTPTSKFADFTALAALGPAQLTLSAAATQHGPEATATITLQNKSSVVAFFVQLKLTGGPGVRRFCRSGGATTR